VITAFSSLFTILLACSVGVIQSEDSWTALSEKQVRQTIAAARVNGQVGSSWDFRVTSTDRSYNYKLRATHITPTVAGAAARMLMLAKGMPRVEAVKAIQTCAENPGHYVLVEIDPREGSGVIPRDWLARFGARGAENRQVTGVVLPDDGVWRTLRMAFPRDYAYDVFLVQFPLVSEDGSSLLGPADNEVELIVRIHNKTGKVRWPAPRQ
jgi:hypothetical protein